MHPAITKGGGFEGMRVTESRPSSRGGCQPGGIPPVNRKLQRLYFQRAAWVIPVRVLRHTPSSQSPNTLDHRWLYRVIQKYRDTLLSC